ncbi:MAG TPA: aldo/keto reductase [Bryobacteraceae bacterium]|nr:aldo/keto reductase [Bryobacteraceae bacterium]
MSGMNRRNWLTLATGASALYANNLHAQQRLITRQIPSSGEALPVIGLGSSATFSQAARSEDVSALGGVLRALVENGGAVFDTAPSYGASEEVSGRIAAEGGLTEKIFWATKVNVARQGKADPAAARAQIETSFSRLKKPKIDLIQVHNVADLPTQLAVLKELKSAGRVRYIGVTSSSCWDTRRSPRLLRRPASRRTCSTTSAAASDACRMRPCASA